MRKVAQAEFEEAVRLHSLWLRKEAGGKRLDFSGRDISGIQAAGADLDDAKLHGADLRRADLRSAILRCADLSDADLSDADLRFAILRSADMHDAGLRSADLRDAKLSGADLRRADLRSAILRCAFLSGADLRDADLRGANLTGAYLTGAIGLVRPDVGLVEDPDGWFTAYKAVTEARHSPMHASTSPVLVYTDGAVLEVPDADASEALCGAGINVGTLPWCQRNYPGCAIVKVRFRREDVAVVPYASDGKFRLFRCEVVGEVTA